jgi:hypothetical protein
MIDSVSAASLKGMVRKIVSRRFLSQGGVTELPDGQFRTDATAWGILAVTAAGGQEDLIERHRQCLIQEQQQDGRLAINRDHSDAYWPTALAVLAWQNSVQCQAAHARATRFLLETTGVHRFRRPDDIAEHDPLLKGWSWVSGTHSWIEPTALAVIALRHAGLNQHERVGEAVQMILDRQLPHGGWNYGNTLVLRRELRPMPESTGAALVALTGMIDRAEVTRSLDYLQGEVGRLQTPISLGWALMGLAGWDLWPSNGLPLVERCLATQSRYGEYDTSALCLLLLGALAGEKGNNVALLASSARPVSR